MTRVIIVKGRDTARLIHQSLVTAMIDEPSWDTEFSIKEVEKKFYGCVSRCLSERAADLRAQPLLVDTPR